jgi:hypothetical protein
MFRQQSAIIRELPRSVWVTLKAEQIGGLSKLYNGKRVSVWNTLSTIKQIEWQYNIGMYNELKWQSNSKIYIELTLYAPN